MNLIFPLPISKRFEEQVRLTPSLSAVEFKTDSLTYHELNQRANQLARFLLSRGVGTEMPIGLCLDRSFEMILGIFGILKAGAAYVPLDPTYSESRLVCMLKDSKASVLITTSTHVGKFASFEGLKICLDVEQQMISKQCGENLSLEISPCQLAYIIYTSGSTGEPKGVMVEQAGWDNYMSSAQEAYGLQPGERLLQFASPSWDTSAEEIFPCLTSGATLVLRPPEMLDSFTRFWDYCDSLNISILSLPTAFWHELVSHLASHPTKPPRRLRVVVTGGEGALAKMVNQWHQLIPEHVQLFNTYGQTECTAVSTRCLLPPSVVYNAVPIGSAIENVSLLVLDPGGNPVLPGDSGELYVGGAGVGRGYLNQEELTAQKFVTLESGRFFRTGDLVRENDEGMLEYIGRTDAQIKIRGVRIEPGEVEAALLRHPAIELAVVVGQPLDQPRKLVAYVTLKQGIDKIPVGLRDSLKDFLPEAFLPSLFIKLESIPRTVNGKVDKCALPAFKTMMEAETINQVSTDELEASILALWREFLKNPHIGIHDNFFENGGDSLIIMQIITELEQKLGCSLPLSMIFHAPTVSRLAEFLREQNAQPAKSALVPVKTTGNRTPLFCVHADGGAFFYLNFAKYLADDQPFYGLQARGLDPKEEPFTSLQEMAAYYVSEIRKIQPQGPYFLGGFSVGGIFAYEMAQQLVSAGQEVGVLAMLDANTSDYPVYKEQGRSTSRKLKQWLQLDTRELLTNSIKRLQARSRKKINNMIVRFYRKMNFPLSPYLRVHLVRQANQSMGERYQPKCYEHPIHVFCAEKQPMEIIPDNSLGWQKYAVEPIHIHSIPGDHETIFREPQVRTLAQAVQNVLDANSFSVKYQELNLDLLIAK
jgi:amino acid adenylation domain-containing protein